jgi:energy-coupling factor transporter ATP-binding protein EcfA2
MNFFTPKSRRIIITGHFGCGKTNIAVNLAFALKAEGRAVTIADMDIVNPYFRTSDSYHTLTEAGIRCVIPRYAGTNVEMTTVSAEIYSMFADNDSFNIFDVGGDDTGAAALGMFAHYFNDSGYEMLYVCSMYRPLTADPSDAAALMHEIEFRSRLHCTAIVNNSNLGAESDKDGFMASFIYAGEVCRLCGLPLAFDSTCGNWDIPGRNVFYMKNITKKLY